MQGESEFTDEERRKYEQQLEELDEKTLLIQQVTELSAIRQQLELLNTRLETSDLPGGSGESVRRCKHCHEDIPESELQSHAEVEHNAPAGARVKNLSLYE